MSKVMDAMNEYPMPSTEPDEQMTSTGQWQSATTFPETLTDKAYAEMENRLAWWESTYQTQISITPRLAAEALAFLDAHTSPCPNIALTSPRHRETLWETIGEHLYKPAFLASMALYRGMVDIKSSVEHNVEALPPLAILMQAITSPHMDRDTKEMAYLGLQKSIESRRFPINDETRKSIVQALAKGQAQFGPTPAANRLVQTLNINERDLAAMAA